MAEVRMISLKPFRNRDIGLVNAPGVVYFAPTESLAVEHERMGFGVRAGDESAPKKGTAQKPKERQAMAPAESQALEPTEVKDVPPSEPTEPEVPKEPEPDETKKPAQVVKRGPGRPRKHQR